METQENASPDVIVNDYSKPNMMAPTWYDTTVNVTSKMIGRNGAAHEDNQSDSAVFA